jgi:hypothetical protein
MTLTGVMQKKVLQFWNNWRLSPIILHTLALDHVYA